MDGEISRATDGRMRGIERVYSKTGGSERMQNSIENSRSLKLRIGMAVVVGGSDRDRTCKEVEKSEERG